VVSKYNVTKEIFSKRLKELMQHNNETTYSMAEQLHLSAATISRYTDGQMAPKITTIDSMARHFNINPAWLMGYDVEKELKLKEVSNYRDLSKEEETLLSNFNNLNNLGKKEAIKRVSELTEINKYINSTENNVTELITANKQKFDDKPHLMPIASHDKEGNFTDEEYKHDDDIMNNDDLWNK
jgi:transcriptional regulator with XRE-family HTH domain